MPSQTTETQDLLELVDWSSEVVAWGKKTARSAYTPAGARCVKIFEAGNEGFSS